MPVALPRSGFTLFDKRSDKLDARYQLRLADSLATARTNHARADRLAARHPPTLAGVMKETHASNLGGAGSPSPPLYLVSIPTLAAALAGNRKKIEYQLSKMRAPDPPEALAARRGESRRRFRLYNSIYRTSTAGAAVFHRPLPGAPRSLI